MNELVQLYQDPRVRALLGVIRDAEGTSKYGDAYRVAGGGKVTLNDLSRPQFHRWGFTDKTGKGDVSTATGAYQFLQRTWDGLAKNYGLNDFSPYSQDLGAIALLKDSGAIPYIQRGDYFGALNAARKIWASLPGAGYNQKERDYKFLKASLEKHLGQPLNMHEQTFGTPQPPAPTQSLSSPAQATELGSGTGIYDPYAKLFNVDDQETSYNEPQQPEQVQIASWYDETAQQPPREFTGLPDVWGGRDDGVYEEDMAMRLFR